MGRGFIGNAQWLLWELTGNEAVKPDMYIDGCIGYWPSNLFRHRFSYRTSAGFKFDFQLSCIVERVDDAEFKRSRMLDKASHVEFMQTYCRDVVAPLLKDRAAFRFHWLGPILGVVLPRPWLTQYIRDDDGTLRPDPNGCDFATLLNSTRYQASGCSITQVMLIDRFFAHLLDENFAMLGQDAVAKAHDEEMYHNYIESVVIAAMRDGHLVREQLLREQHEQKHEGDLFTITTTMSHGDIKIAWKLATDAKLDGRLIGVKETDGFAHSVHGSMDQGTCVADSDRNGSVVEHLEPGQQRYYTFAVRTERNFSVNPFKEKIGLCYDSVIRFTVRAPSARDEEVRLKAEVAVKELREKLAPSMAERSELTEVLQKIDTFKKMSGLLDEQYRQGLAEIESMADGEDKERRREVWESLFEQLRMTYNV
jgi:hypothetical protein